MGRSLAGALVLLAASVGTAVARSPSLVYVLLDTTRADRLGAWGHAAGTSPALDALAASGVRFARHFANSHATRPSMPQLMTGRYYGPNILGPFLPDAHPREMSFARPDPSLALLPRILAGAGYASAGVSAHTWVGPDSEFGRAFDHFELLPFGVEEGHGDARPLVDRAVALWEARDPDRPFFLYVHFMDAHIPRRVPPGVSPDLVPGYDWRRRFRDTGEPAFARDRRAWSRFDASDFTPADRAYYAARYDVAVRYADGEMGRLLAAIRRGDPHLDDTVVVVTSDHGEELGEDGRVEHSDSLADGVQHVPFVVAGAGIAAGQVCAAATEHVDVLPTLLEVLGVSLPPGIEVDGSPLLRAGRLRQPCGRRTAFYAWESYRAVRAGRYLLVQHPPDAPPTACEGAERLYRLDRGRLTAADPRTMARKIGYLRRVLEARLGERERGYRARRYDRPRRPFLLRSEFLALDDMARVRCVVVSEGTPRRALLEPGWFWTGRGLALVAGTGTALQARVRVPDGAYRVEAATRPIPPPPWFVGQGRWRRRAFRREEPSASVPLGAVEVRDGVGNIALPEDRLSGHHVLGLRLVPPGAPERQAAPLDAEQQERLRALGYLD